MHSAFRLSIKIPLHNEETVYLLPLTFPAMFRMEGPRRRIATLLQSWGGGSYDI